MNRSRRKSVHTQTSANDSGWRRVFRKSPFAGSKVVLSASTIIVSLVILSFVFHAQATSPPMLSMPDLSGHCLNKGATVTTALTASNLTITQGWQVNVTFTPGQIATKSYVLGTPFTGQNTFSAVKNSTSSGYFLLGMSFYNGAGPYTTTSQVTLVTITWKTLVYHATVDFHIVTNTENTQLGTKLLDPNLNSQAYTTTDGFLGCQLRPSP